MAFALLTHTQKDAASSPTTSTAIDTTGATLIVLAVATSQVGITVTDSQSNKWFGIQPVTASGTQNFTFFFCVNPTTNASHTFTLSAGNFPSFCVAAFSGSVGAFTPITTNAVNASTMLMPSITPSLDNALIVTGLCGPNPDTESINGSFTITDQGGGTNGQRVALAYLIQTSAAAAAPTWTNSASRQLAGQMVVINLQAAAGGSAGGSYVFGG